MEFLNGYFQAWKSHGKKMKSQVFWKSHRKLVIFTRSFTLSLKQMYMFLKRKKLKL